MGLLARGNVGRASCDLANKNLQSHGSLVTIAAFLIHQFPLL
jgi:hypothetical protein